MPFLASATANGTMSLAFPHIFKSICELKISEYPFDTQNCPLTFGSWAYNESEVVINIDVLRSAQYTVNSKAWKIMGTNCQKKPSRCVFDDDDESCNTAHCFIELRRSAWFEVISYTLPTIIIAALSLMVFMVPPEAGKRMGKYWDAPRHFSFGGGQFDHLTTINKEKSHGKYFGQHSCRMADFLTNFLEISKY